METEMDVTVQEAPHGVELFHDALSDQEDILQDWNDWVV